MIKNVVFDLGNVLVRFHSKEYLQMFSFDEVTRNKLYQIIFAGEDWKKYDSGEYLHNTDLIEKLSNDYPELSQEISLVLNDDWVKMHTLKEDVISFLKDLKQRNFKIYILSNLAKDSYDFIHQYDFYQFVDGGVYSYQEGINKPDKRIYEILLQRYDLIPEETIFIDDKPENIEAAKQLGIHGVVFSDFEQVKQEVEEMIKK